MLPALGTWATYAEEDPWAPAPVGPVSRYLPPFVLWKGASSGWVLAKVSSIATPGLFHMGLGDGGGGKWQAWLRLTLLGKVTGVVDMLTVISVLTQVIHRPGETYRVMQRPWSSPKLCLCAFILL